MQSRKWLSLLLVIGLAGCSNLLGDREGSEQAARAHFAAEFTKWMAGQESEAETVDAGLKSALPPLAYEIRSVVTDEPYSLAFRTCRTYRTTGNLGPPSASTSTSNGNPEPARCSRT